MALKRPRKKDGAKMSLKSPGELQIGSGDLLDHIKYSFVFPKPNVMIGNGHCLKGDALGILEERIGPPNHVEPFMGMMGA